MGSIAAEQVAKGVLEKVGKGERPVVGELMKEAGYPPSMCKNPKKVTETVTYKTTINPVVEQMERIRNKILKELERRDPTTIEYRDLSRSLDTFTKNIQLLSGKETERTGISFNVTNYGDNYTV